MTRRVRRPSRGSLVPGGLIVAAATLLLAVGTPLVHGALNVQLANSTNTAGDVGYFTCTSAALGGSGLGSYSTWPLNETGGTTATDVSGNGHNGTYSGTGVTYGVAGPCPRDGARAVTFDGASGSVGDATGVALSTTSPQSDEVYFKTTTTAGGVLITSFSSTSPLLGGADRVLYMQSSGQVAFGVYSGTVHILTSPIAYNDGKWHLADGVFSSTAGTALYIDGNLVASNSTYTTADPFTAYTRIASGQLLGWTNSNLTVPSTYWAGSEAFASIYRYALSGAQVAAHYAASRTT